MTNIKIFIRVQRVLHPASSDLGEVNSFYNSFSDLGQKAPHVFKTSLNPAWYRVNFQNRAIIFLS